MEILGATNKIVLNIHTLLMNNENIAKLLYYNQIKDISINELPKVDNPKAKLKDKLVRNKRIEKLQRDSDVAMSVSLYSKTDWYDNGRKYDKNVKNYIEVGVCCHEDCDWTVNGSRLYALIDLVIKELDSLDYGSVGKVHFDNMYRTKDLALEYNGYVMYFTVYNLKEEL